MLTKGEMKQNIKMSLPKNRHQNSCQTGKFHKICLTNMSGIKGLIKKNTKMVSSTPYKRSHIHMSLPTTSKVPVKLTNFTKCDY